MPAPLALIPLAIRVFIGIKVVGFVISWATSATNASMRKSFLEHVEHVREGLQEAEIALSNSDDAALLADIETLRNAAGSGWTEPNETLALWNVMKFLSWSHSMATASGVSKLTLSHLNAAYSFAQRAGRDILEALKADDRE